MKAIINKPTIKDVAQKAGVSVATVSRILNGLEGYSEETKEKVNKAIIEMNYQRNEIARHLKIKRTHTIGVLLPTRGTSFYIELLNGIQDVAHKNKYSVVNCNTGDQWQLTNDYLRVLAERQVDGMIICSLPAGLGYDKTIYDTSIPSVLVSTVSDHFQIPYIKVDDFRASYAATLHLIQNGHRQIAFLGGDKDDRIAGKPRLQGYLEALREYQIPVKESLIKHTHFSFKDGVLGMKQLLNEKETFTAIFAACDDIAVGALSVAYHEGIKVPDELSIIGYDNTNAAEMCYPPLTTVAQPLYQMGERAVELLIQSIETGKKGESIIMPYEIIERKTVKPLV